MAWIAACDNENCGKEPWQLQKNPGQYSRGVTCPECGSTRVTVDQTSAGQRAAGDGGQETGQAPARREAQQGGAPARQEERSMSGTQTAIALLDDDVGAEKRAEAAQNAAGVLGNVAGELLRYRDQKKQAKDQRAQNVELEPADKYPECECGYQFDGGDIGLKDDSVKCPECGAIYNVRDAAPE